MSSIAWLHRFFIIVLFTALFTLSSGSRHFVLAQTDYTNAEQVVLEPLNTLNVDAHTSIGLSYQPFDESLSERIILHSIEDSAFDGEKISSPNKLGAFWSMFPNFSEEAPWSTTFYIEYEGKDALRLAFLNHANVLPRAQWINDELLYVNVWWGRIAGSDLILDVAREKFIYKKMFYFNLNPTPNDTSSTDDGLPELNFHLEHIEGALPPDFKSITLTSSIANGDKVRQIALKTLPPMITECFVEAKEEQIEAIHSLLQDFLAEREENAPPHSLDTVCRNCTIYHMSWTIDGTEMGSFDFSEQRPLRYLVMDGLFPLIDGWLEHMKKEGECGA